MTYISRVRGSIEKRVCCEQCQTEYVYRMERVADGKATAYFFFGLKEAQEESAKNAAEELRRMLEVESDLVPCPQCGHFHTQMVAEVVSRRHPGAKKAGVVMLLLSGFFALLGFGSRNEPLTPQLKVGNVMLIIAALLGVGAVISLLGRLVVTHSFNPNQAFRSHKEMATKGSRSLRIEGRFSFKTVRRQTPLCIRAGSGYNNRWRSFPMPPISFRGE